MEDINKKNIYSDLVRELADRGYNLYVVAPRERRMKLNTELSEQENIKILKVKTGNITKTNFIEKGISTLLIEWQFLFAIKKYFKGVKFDMVISSTPPITFEKIMKHFKNKHNTKSYLILKDIFPQNAVDMDIIKKDSLLWKYFRWKEKKLYKASDIIGCMSKANVDYILKNNKFIAPEMLEIFPNSIEPLPREEALKKDKAMLRKYDIPENKVLYIYGGNLGKPQGIDFLLEVADDFKRIKNSYLMIVGQGTEYNKIKNYLNENNIENVSLHKKLPKKDYDKLLFAADVGLIFLDKRFTIPNFPSRLTSYMEFGIPTLAATDTNTDLDEVLRESNSGFWVESGNLDGFIKKANKLSNNKSLRQEMGYDGRVYLEENYDVSKTANIITKHL